MISYVPRRVPWRSQLRARPPGEVPLAAKAWLAPGSRRANDMSIPSPTIVTSTDDSPWDTSGSGTPVIGEHADHRADVHHGLADDPDGDRRGQQPAERVGRAPRHAQAGEGQPPVQRRDAERADQAEFLADDREDEVARGLRQPAPLLPARAEAHAEDAAGAEGVLALDGLHVRSRPGRCSCECPRTRSSRLRPVALRHHEQQQHEPHEDQQGREDPPGRARRSTAAPGR